MIDYTLLPGLNASLNGLSGILLCLGYVSIRRGRIPLHRAFMIAAFSVSTLFLASYLIYHFEVGSVPFRGQGAVRPVYFTLLISHVILAAAVVPLALLTLRRGWRDDRPRHRRIARWTLPIWLFVSVSGVLVYLMLYVWFPEG